jgi:hypothetical protein
MVIFWVRQYIFLTNTQMEITMRKATTLVVMTLCLFVTGCGNDLLSPRSDPRIDNQEGRIDNLENNVGTIRTEIGRLGQHAESMEKVQQGFLNAQLDASSSNTGIQILQGGGALFMMFCLLALAMLLYYLYTEGKRHKQAAKIMADKIKGTELEESVAAAALYTDAEKEVYNLIRN